MRLYYHQLQSWKKVDYVIASVANVSDVQCIASGTLLFAHLQLPPLFNLT